MPAIIRTLPQLFRSWVIVNTSGGAFYPEFVSDIISIAANEEELEAALRHLNTNIEPVFRACTVDEFLRRTNFSKPTLRRVFNNLTHADFSDFLEYTWRKMDIIVSRAMRLKGESTHQRLNVAEWQRTRTRKNTAVALFHEAVVALRGFEKRADSANYRHMRRTCTDLFEYVRESAAFNRVTPEKMFQKITDIAEDIGVDTGDLPFTLADCGHWELREDMTAVHGGDEVCEACREDDYRWVDSEDEYYHYRDCHYWESDGEYHLEPEPEERDDDGELLESWGASTGHLAHDRSFTPSQWGDFTLGVELEVEAEEDRYDRLGECDNYFNRDMRYAMFKQDGSLNEYRGFEIVTAARKLGDHIEMFKRWQPRKLTAWQAGNCGMHVHIDSRAFSSLSLGKFMMFMNDHGNTEFIGAIAGRHPLRDSQAESYAATTSQETLINPVQAKKGAGSTRYRLVNLTNLGYDEQRRLQCTVDRNSKGSYSTVELRVFRATLKKERLLAQIEFTHAAVMYCRVASWHDLNGPKFKDWLSRTPGYPHLAKWLGVVVCRSTPLKSRSNAPVAEEV